MKRNLQFSDIGRQEIAKRCLLLYKQSWGQSVDERIAALNAAAEAAGLKCRFRQGPNGEAAGWYGDDTERGVSFRRAIDGCWHGSFEAEESAIIGVIDDYRMKRDLSDMAALEDDKT